MYVTSETFLFWGTFITLLHSSHVSATVLSKVTKIALDSSRRLEAKRMKALYASYSNTSPFWIQLWNRTTSNSTYRLDWQIRIRPRFGDGSLEVLNLSSSQFVQVVPSVHVLAMMNERIPGPLNGNYRGGGGVILSLQDRDHMGLPLNRSALFQFDNLLMPYHLPVTLCNQTGCPYELGVPPTEAPSYKPVKPVSRRASRLLTEEMVVGLITWNIVLTLLVFLVLLVLVFICADLEKRRKDSARYGLDVCSSSCSVSGLSGGYVAGHTAFPAAEPALPVTDPDMVEIRDADSDIPLTPEALEKMPSSRF